jgi:hypothetical protein
MGAVAKIKISPYRKLNLDSSAFQPVTSSLYRLSQLGRITKAEDIQIERFSLYLSSSPFNLLLSSLSPTHSPQHSGLKWPPSIILTQLFQRHDKI